MDNVAHHVRETWSYAGAEVNGSTATKLHITVGPDFPVSDFCADMATTFDAIVSMQHTSGNGVGLVVALHAPPVPLRSQYTFPWFPFVIVVVVIAVAWRLDDIKQHLTPLIMPLPPVK